MEKLSTGDVARSLGVTINTVRSWIRSGKVKAVRLPSGHYRIPAAERERLLRGVRAEAFEYFAEWRRANPPEPRDIESVLKWNDEALEIARSQDPPTQADLEEKARRVSEMHRSSRSSIDERAPSGPLNRG